MDECERSCIGSSAKIERQMSGGMSVVRGATQRLRVVNGNRSVAVSDERDRAVAERAVRAFCDWLYERGPDPNLVTRERLLAEYRAWRTEGGNGTTASP